MAPRVFIPQSGYSLGRARAFRAGVGVEARVEVEARRRGVGEERGELFDVHGAVHLRAGGACVLLLLLLLPLRARENEMSV